MLEIRWHSRAGQGAVTGAKGLADIVARTGKKVQAFATYGSAKRGEAMAAFDKIDDKPILNHEKYMSPDYVLVIDPGLTFITDIFESTKPTTKYIITTHLSKEELIAKKPELKDKEFYVVDCIKISLDTLGKPIPNAPMLGALIKVTELSGDPLLKFDFFKEAFKDVLGKKLPQKLIDGNMLAVQRAYDEVK
ncbi:pyruvate ferredoxin oxidoreductase [Helicobacter sp. 13S00401-1]|uniref:pyruvate flavodoxin oxidoreductase subunit gamma n=1 Tax=Helicobacter sp. 13S00401-1 TaxID=1905758 RepID=UPI000BA5E904|nr:pyruvate flavodoxin oxidoreductase subunit gamma [Helicobacter sp. 13S00401-1]PAF51378.1 pyruvate ferredoxin oxidoreductase [Helicobacter sp. 13S00401-1]